VPGTHTILFDSPFDTIELTHRARSRGGLALGAVRAAEWLSGRSGVFEVNDFIQDFLRRSQA
jgi:4-hydroxy-tetrahydrodipicolinate reductase